MTYKLVSDLEADHAQQQENREEGIKEKKVLSVSGQSAWIAFINDLIAMSDHTGSRKRFGSIACEVESMELSDDEKLTAVLLESQVAEPLENHRHLLCAP